MWIYVSLCFLVSSVAIIYTTWRRSRKAYLISKMPGPSLLASLKLFSLIAFMDNNQVFKLMDKLFDTYGSIVSGWYGPFPVIALRDPQCIEKFCKQDQACRRLPNILNKKLAEPVFKGGILALQEDEWKKDRKILNHGFHSKTVESFVNNFDKNTEILVNRLDEYANGSFHELLTLFTQCVLDVIIENMCGYSQDFQKRNDVTVVESFRAVVEVFETKMFKPWLYIDLIYNMCDATRKQASAITYIHGLINDGITKKLAMYEEMRQNGEDIAEYIKTKGTLADTLLFSSEVTRDYVVGEITSIVGAGVETTSLTCCFTLALLSENQDIQERVMEEQRNIFSEDLLCPITNEHLNSMTYLEQVIKETLRLYPGVLATYRSPVQEIDIGNGHIIPKGSIVVINYYATHRNKDYFPNPNGFDPDRFSPENCVGIHSHAYIPFGGGRRNCVGYKFATMEIKSILSAVLRRYHFLAVEGGMKSINENLVWAIAMKPSIEFKFKFEPRKI